MFLYEKEKKGAIFFPKSKSANIIYRLDPCLRIKTPHHTDKNEVPWFLGLVSKTIKSRSCLRILVLLFCGFGLKPSLQICPSNSKSKFLSSFLLYLCCAKIPYTLVEAEFWHCVVNLGKLSELLNLLFTRFINSLKSQKRLHQKKATFCLRTKPVLMLVGTSQ